MEASLLIAYLKSRTLEPLKNKKALYEQANCSMLLTLEEGWDEVKRGPIL